MTKRTRLSQALLLTLLACALLATGCSSDDPPYDWQDPALRVRLTEALNGWAQDLGLEGASAVVLTPGQFEWTGAYGLDSVEDDTPYQVDTVGYVGSVTKAFTASVVMQLIDEGKLSLDTRLSEFLPDYPNASEITVEHLLRHRSGIPEVQLVDLLFVASVLINPGHWLTPIDILDWTYKKLLPMIDMNTFAPIPRGPVAAPGEKFHYSQPGYVALGYIVEQVTGHPLADAFQERICTPLGLTGTRLTRENDPFQAAGYSNLFGLLPEKVERREVVGENANGFHSSSWSAGGLVSTAPDLARFLAAMLNAQLFSTDGLALVTDWMPEGENSDYEYGMGLSTQEHLLYQSVGHNGSLPGGGAIMQYIPEMDVYVSAVRNTDPDPVDVSDLVSRVFLALLN